MKKLILSALLVVFGMGVMTPLYAQTTTPGGFGKVDAVKGIGVPGTEDAKDGGDSQLLDSITNVINWILGLLATIALVLCLYGGFQIVTAAGDDGKHKNGMKILKQAAIGLLIIGFSWLVISLVFWLIAQFSGAS